MKRRELDIAGTPRTVSYEQIAGTLWLHVDGETFCFEQKQRRGRSRSSQAGGTLGETVAPMPGKIIKILAAEGQKIESGEVAVVLEAMKMEYTLKSNIGGEVLSIAVEVGQQVKAGELLVKVQPEESGDQ